MSLEFADNFESAGNYKAFAAWAQIYDTQPNPLLSLEERYLTRVLPSARGKDVLDAGCGTGRWLCRLAESSPSSLHGIDSSSEMLAVARHTCASKTSLIMAQLPLLPLNSRSIDLAICSFVLSYISDIECFASQLRRVLRDGGDLVITDMHPETASVLGWRRNFNVAGARFDLLTENRSIEAIQRAFEEQGFQTDALYQPAFGDPEVPVFIRGRNEASYAKTVGCPAIYVLHLRSTCGTASRCSLTLTNTKVVLGAQEIDSGDISIDDKEVASFISGGGIPSTDISLDLSGYTLFPGLINAHEHLEFGLFPRLGNPPYKNATEWAHDIHCEFESVIKTHTAVPRDVRLWWGALRNLLCGVTTVCHHNPAHPVLHTSCFPVQVISSFDWAHSLAFSDDILERHQNSHASRPFIIHACEGVDAAACAEFARLIQMNLLDDRIVLVHGLAMTSDEINELNRRGASLISCPSSNQFLFAKAPSLDQLLKVNRLAIGSDSPLTADGDLLDEISFCHEMLRLDPIGLFNLVTSSPASILGLPDGAGSIVPGAPANCFAVRSSSVLPAQHLMSIRWYDVELVIVGGAVRLASDEIRNRLPVHLRNVLRPLSIDGVIRWINSPVPSFFGSAANVLGAENIAIHGRRILMPSLSPPVRSTVPF